MREADVDRINGGQAHPDRAQDSPTPVTPKTPAYQLPSNVEKSQDETRGAMTHDDMLMENDFHDVVNSEMKDDEMYDEIRSIRADLEDMISSIVATIQKHV